MKLIENDTHDDIIIQEDEQDIERMGQAILKTFKGLDFEIQKKIGTMIYQERQKAFIEGLALAIQKQMDNEIMREVNSNMQS